MASVGPSAAAPIERFVNLVLANVCTPEPGSLPAVERGVAERTGRPSTPMSRLHEVAAAYREHGSAAGAATVLGVSRSQAFRLVRQAREAGLL